MIAHSLFHPDALAQRIAGWYHLSDPVSCALVSPGVNDTYRVVAGDGLWYYRIYRAGLRSRSDIAFELELLQHLEREGVHVSLPVPRRDGAYVTELDAPEGLRPAVLFTPAPGQVLEYAEADAYAYGRTVARLHTAMDSFRSGSARFRLDLDHLLEEPLRLIQPFAVALGHWGVYSELGARLRARVQAVEHELEQGLCHGDLHGHNVHKAEDGRLTLFDFDCGGPGWRAYDLAVYRWAVGRHAPNLEPWHAFVRGYQSLRPIKPVDLEIIPVFAALRIFWLVGLHVQQVHQRGTASVEMWVSGAAQALRQLGAD